MLLLKHLGEVVQVVEPGSWFILPNGDKVSPAQDGWSNDDGYALEQEQTQSHPPSFEELVAQKLAAANDRYSAVLGIIRDQYTQDEREGWAEQVQSALAYQAGQDAPLVTTLAAARGVDQATMAAHILAKRAAYQTIYGAATGRLGAIRDAIAAAGEDQEALDAIDVNAGWPEQLP